MFKAIFTAILLSLSMLLVSGCSSMSGEGLHPEEFKILARNATIVAVSRLITESDSPGEVAQKVYDTSTETAEKLRNGSLVSVDALGDELREGIDWESLTAEEAALVNDVIRVVEIEMQRRLAAVGENPNDYAEELATFLDEVAEAASFYIE